MVEADSKTTVTAKPKIDWHDGDSDYDDEDDGPMIGDENNSSTAKTLTPAKGQQSDTNDGAQD